MNTHLFNGLVSFVLLLTTLVAANPMPAQIMPETTFVSMGLDTPIGPEAVGVELSPGYSQITSPGTIITYTHILTNTGTNLDTFVVQASSSQTWSVALLSPTGTLNLPLQLDSGLSATVMIRLTVPTPVISGTVDMTTITVTSQTDPAVAAIAADVTTVRNVPRYVFLPLALKRWPPLPDAPVLNPISNPDSDGNYTVSWNAAYLATTYTLQEDDNLGFSSPAAQYTGAGTAWLASGKPGGAYYYRVKATNSWGDSGWSNIQSAIALPGIHGRITYQGVPIVGAPVSLQLYYSTIRTTTTQADGIYQFTDAPTLTSGQMYSARYLNSTNPSFVARCAGRDLLSYTAGASVAGGDFDIANIPQMSPPNAATIALPYTFQWTRRPGVPSDSYILEIWNGDPSYDWWETPPLGYISQYTLNSLPSGLSLGTPYWWDVAVDTRAAGGGFCYSFDQNRTVTFSSGVTSSHDTVQGLRRLQNEDMRPR